MSTAVEPQTADISTTYDGSKLFIGMLRGCHWGPEMLNFGYYPWHNRAPFISINKGQRELAYRLISLLGIEQGDSVLDIACGRGGTSDLLRGSTTAGHVCGIDLLPENIEIARAIFSEGPRLKYQVGNAQDISFDDGSFDRAMCCEAAFHFPDRAKFISEVARVLKPGGRFAMCDFVWQSENARLLGFPDERCEIVRRIWEYDDMALEAEYRGWCEESGLRFVEAIDWSRNVTGPLLRAAEVVVRSQKRRLGRRLLFHRRPQLKCFTDAEWVELERGVKAHRFVTDLTFYKAFVIEKPAD